MSKQCCHVDEWAPLFAFFQGTGQAKYNDSQIEVLARQGTLRGWCNLGDAPIEGNPEAHVRMHMRELRDWRKRRARDAAKKSKQGLATYRKERALTESVLEPQDEEA